MIRSVHAPCEPGSVLLAASPPLLTPLCPSQALTSVVVVAIIFIYACVTFRAPLGPLPSYMSWDNYYGLAAIAVMPISLISATLFSEAMWQRYGKQDGVMVAACHWQEQQPPLPSRNSVFQLSALLQTEGIVGCSGHLF